MNVIEVVDAVKNYKTVTVLSKLSMKIEYGSIFVLLGSSGCGKTTLLSCLVGSKKLDSGSVKIFNEAVGRNKAKIGFMPQDLGLVEEFSTKELLFFFGAINGMSEKAILDRLKFLAELLELPNVNEEIRKLSGGQKRRVSFAMCLVHRPELLLLDEPTVGLDPVLRWKIWDYLKFIAKSEGTSVLITTHYIEEARNADKMGFLRNGSLIAQDSPSRLLEKLAVDDLEQAFVKLCEGQENKSSKNLNTFERDFMEIEEVVSLDQSLPLWLSEENQKHENSNSSFRKLKALIRKNFIQTTRRPAALGFLLLTPFLCLISFFLTIGSDPIGLKIGIVNNEVMNSSECSSPETFEAKIHGYNCYVSKISCRFINTLNDSIASKNFYDNVDDALEDAHNGKITGYIKFGPNFTSTIHPFNEIVDLMINQTSLGEIEVFLDQSDRQITFFLKQRLFDVFEKFIGDLMEDCGKSRRVGYAPIQINTMFGSLKDEMKNSMFPGVIVSMYFFLASIVTSTAFISDRLDGVWDRVLLAGVKPIDILISHIFTSSLVIILQICELHIITTYVFKIEVLGNYLIIMALVFLVGISAIMYGLSVSIISNDYMTATFMSSLVFYPMMIMCGIFWPIEAIPWYFRYLAYCLPFTLPSAALRNVLYKGYDFYHSSVQIGFAVVIGWIAFSVVLCILGLKAKRFR